MLEESHGNLASTWHVLLPSILTAVACTSAVSQPMQHTMHRAGQHAMQPRSSPNTPDELNPRRTHIPKS